MFKYIGWKDVGYGKMAEFVDLSTPTYSIHENENLWLSEKDIKMRINVLNKRNLNTSEENKALNDILGIKEEETNNFIYDNNINKWIFSCHGSELWVCKGEHDRLDYCCYEELSCSEIKDLLNNIINEYNKLYNKLMNNKK